MCAVGGYKVSQPAGCSQSHGNNASSLLFPIFVGTVCSGGRQAMMITAFVKKTWASELFAVGEAEVRWSLGPNEGETTALGGVADVYRRRSCSS